MVNNTGTIILYTTNDGNVPANVQFMDETFWLTQKQKVLEGKGRVPKDDAFKKAEGVYSQFRVRQDEEYISEFDRDMAKYLKGGGSDE
jgi:hypothetical protein